MPRYIFGDSYGDVGNRELATDQSNDSRFFNWLAANRAQQEMADKAKSGSENLQLSYDQLAAAQDNQQADRDYRMQALNQNANLFNKQIASNSDIAKMQLLAGQHHLDRADTTQAYNEAYNAIQSGNVTTPQELEQLIGDRITPEQKQRLGVYLATSFNKHKLAYDEGERARQAMDQEYQNRVGPYQSQVDEISKKITTAPNAADVNWTTPHLWNWFGANPTKEKLQADLQNSGPVMMRNSAQERLFQDMGKSHRLDKLVDYDPMSHSFVNIVPKPTPLGGLPTSSGAQSPSASPEQQTGVPVANWIPVPSVGIRVNPSVFASIKQGASTLPTDADRFAYMRQKFAEALAAGQAIKITPTNAYRGVANLNMPYF